MYSQEEKNIFLFQSVHDNIKEYGIAGLEFILNYYINIGTTTPVLTCNKTLASLNTHISNAVNKFGIDFVICLIQNTPNKSKKKLYKIKSVKIKDKVKLTEVVFNIVTDVFQINKENILLIYNKSISNRVFAIGTLCKLFIDFFDYTPQDIIKITNLTYSIISNNKCLINKLDYNHPFEKKKLKLYLLAKYRFINYILKNND